MLTIQPIKGSSKDAAHYYSEIDNYYLSDKESLEQASTWLGKGSDELGLSGMVKEDQFIPLLEGKLPSGQQLGITINGELKHRSGTDVTCSAPKSLSILALVGGDKRLIEAHKKAVIAVVDALEKMAAEARITINGDTQFEKTKNLVIASFLHMSSRELDPQLHTHLAILNMTKRFDGHWRALSSRDKQDIENLYNGFREILYDNQHYFGLIYNSTLAKETVDLGYDINVVDRYGNFEIEGVPKEYIESQSKRRQQVKEQQKKWGSYGAKSAEAAALSSRKQKQNVSSEELKALWLSEAVQHDVDLNGVIEEAKTKVENQDLSVDFNSEQIKVEINKVADKSVQDAIDHLSSFNAQIHHADIVRQAYAFSPGKINHIDIENSIKSKLANEELLNPAPHLYTTTALLEKETNFKKEIAKGINRSFSIQTGKSDLASNILKLKDTTHIVHVYGNKNESKLLQSFVDAGDKNKVNTYILHPLKFQQNELRASVEHENNTLWQKIKNLFREELVHSVNGFTNMYEHNVEFYNQTNRNDVIVVCDAQKLDFDAIERLNRLALKSKSKLVLLNNRASAEGARAGSPIKALLDNNIKSYMSNFKHNDCTCEIIQSLAHLNDVADAFIKERTNDIVLVSMSKMEQDELTSLIRFKLKGNGALSFQEKSIQVISSEQLSEKQREHCKFYNIGDKVLLNPWTKDQKICEVIEAANGNVQMKDKKGEVHTLDLTTAKEFAVLKSRSLDIAIGEELTLNSNLTVNYKDYKKGQRLRVEGLSNEGVTVSINGNEYFLSNALLKDTSLSYDYVKRKNNLDKEYSKIQLSAKAYQINRQLIGELSEYSKSIQIIATDKAKVVSYLEKDNIPYSVLDSANNAMNLVQRDISDLPNTIKQDIETLYNSLEAKGHLKSSKEVAEQAVSYALSKCQERNAATINKELLSEALMYSLGKADIKDISEVIKNKVREGSLLYCNTHWINKKELELETSILDTNIAHKLSLSPIVSDKNTLLYMNPALTQGQKDAVFLTLTTKDRFITIQGFAGVGKTTMATEIRAIAEKNNSKVFGITPTNKAKQELEDRGIETQTVESFLISERSFPENSLFILDEASMVGNHLYKSIQDKIIALSGRLATSGDRTQLQGIPSGVPHELNIETKTQAMAEMKDIVRQNANPILKEAVYDATRGDIASAHEKMGSISPQNWVDRDTKNDEFKTSVMEVEITADPKTKERDASEICQKVADDYLSRTDECRENTLVIAHSNEDREHINQRIRSGLKEKEIVSNKEILVDRYLPKDMTKADKLLTNRYKEGEIIRFNTNYSFAKSGDYFFIKEIKEDRLICSDKNNNNYEIDRKSLKEGRMSVYENKPSFLSQGDSIRLKRTELSKGRFANDTYKVKSTDKGVITIERDGVLHQLDPKSLGDRHWDYAYTDTAYTSQGASSKWVISLELSYRTQSTNWRSMLIDVSRACLQHTSYTDDHKALMSRVNDYKKQIDTDKKSAYLMYNAYQNRKNKEIYFRGISSEKSEKNLENDRVFTEKTRINYLENTKRSGTYSQFTHSISDIESQLLSRSDTLCEHLLGAPNRGLSKPNNYRYGKKGSLSIQLNTGLWKDFESGGSGNVFGLIQSQLGMNDFKDALKYAKNFLDIPEVSKNIGTLKQPNKETGSSENQENSKKEYAQKIYKKSREITGTLGQKYLEKYRNISNSTNINVRFIDALDTKRDGRNIKLPAILAATFDEKNDVNNIQVIRLSPKNGNKIKDKEILTKQTYGACNGLGSELNPHHDNGITYIAEGIETGLSIIEAKRDARVVVTFGVDNFKNLKFEKFGREVCFCLDNDGDNTYKKKSIFSALINAENQGKKVSYLMPKTEGHDVNDVLISSGKESVLELLDAKKHPSEYMSKLSNVIRKSPEISKLYKEIEVEKLSKYINNADRACQKLSSYNHNKPSINRNITREIGEREL